MKTCFLLGSGISLRAKLPSVQNITNQVLSTKADEDDWPIRTINPPNLLVEFQTPDRERLGHFLRWLKSVAESCYAEEAGRPVNYEDLAYLAAQIRDDLCGEYENPALGPLIYYARKSLLGLYSVCEEDPVNLERLAGQASDYISDVIVRMLGKPPAPMGYLRLFSDAVIALSFGEVSFFTLNHDCLLERFLRSEQVNVIDGFNDENGLGIRVWNPDVFDRSPVKNTKPTVRLFKLHGSIDWRRFRPQDVNPDIPWGEEYVGIRSCSLFGQCKDESGRMHEVLDRPLFLAGTFNKISGYLNHVFLELHYRFHRTLAESSRLAACRT